MRIMTYNVHGCVGTDGVYDAQRILEVVRDVDPDVLGLQEVRLPGGSVPDILELLETGFPGYSILFGRTLEDERGAYGNALVSRYPIQRHTDLSLEIGASFDTRRTKVEDRRAIIASVTLPDNTPLTVIVTHLGLERWARKKQAETLIAGIDAAVFLGDFNEWFFADRFLRRVDRHFSKHVVRRTFPSRFPILPLDRIWISAGLQRTETRVHRRWPARVASDHLPLYVEVGLPAD